MTLKPVSTNVYHVFLASPGDVNVERQYVRRFFEEYNRHTAHLWDAEFRVVDWENHSSIGVGRPQELITRQTLERFKDSLALVVGVMAQRFGSPSGKAESGTEEEFLWAKQCHDATGFPEIKWFFRKLDRLEFPTDPEEAFRALAQWEKVQAFRKRMQDLDDPVFFTEYPGSDGFAKVFVHDLNLWLNDPARPWAQAIATSARAPVIGALPAAFDAKKYQGAVLKRFEKLNLEMVDLAGTHYGIRLWTVFTPQSVRECHQYNPRILEIPKDHQQRLLEAGEIDPKELEENQQQEAARRDYFRQPLRPILEIIDQAFREGPSRQAHRLVILGDPGSGKSSLMRYVALRWASIADAATREAQPIPLVIDLGNYGRWRCEGRKSFVRFLEEAPVWHDWQPGVLEGLLAPPGRVVLLLDGLDEIFDPQLREEVVNDIQRFSADFAQTPIVITSRIVGYQAHRLRDADFRHFMLQDLDATQIDEFIDRWHAHAFDDAEQAAPKLERLKKAIGGSRSIAMLAGNPLLLTMMAILNRNQEMPRDRVDLYAQASRLLLHQWDMERALAEFPGLSADIGWREKHDLLRRIAAYMQSAPGGLKGNMIDGGRLTGIVEDYLHADLRFPQSRAAARAVVEHLRQRNFILCFVGADSYGFVHRTFLEYFCAADFVQQFNARTLDEDGLLALFDLHCGDDDWREVLRLICGQIDEPFVGKIVARLAKRTNLDKWTGHTTLPEIPLAIWCLSEARNIARLEETGHMLLERVADTMRKVFNQELGDSLQRACEELGPRWPGKAAIHALVKTQPARFVLGSGPMQNYWPKLCAMLGAAREDLLHLASATVGPVGGMEFQMGAIEAIAKTWPDDRSRPWIEEQARGVRSLMNAEVALQALVEHWPDDRTRELLLQQVNSDRYQGVRSAALTLLADVWPDESARTLLSRCAESDPSQRVRIAALTSLAGTWPDAAILELLRASAIDDDDGDVRGAALASLASASPSPATRELLLDRAISDVSVDARSTALVKLALQWPDEATRTLLRARAIEDEDGSIRGAALESLAEAWPEEATCELLRARAADEPDWKVRRMSLNLLVQSRPDAVTRGLVQRAVDDEYGDVRGAALELLATTWPDVETRELIEACALDDQASDVRTTALQSLAEGWPQEESTRQFLHARAIADEDSEVRQVPLQLLATRWPVDSTRRLLEDRAMAEPSANNRGIALSSLVAAWPDGPIRALLRARAVEDPDDSVRGVAFNLLAALHSSYGSIVSSRDLDGVAPFLDPLRPVPPEHLTLCARQLGLAGSELQTLVDALDHHLGWRIEAGAVPMRTSRKKRPTGRGSPPAPRRKPIR